jgi:hypothetical protein
VSTAAEQRALNAVEAALYAYSTVGARLDAAGGAAAGAAHSALRAQRDILHAWITGVGAKPSAPPAAYVLGPLTDVSAARRVALLSELALADAFAVLVRDEAPGRRASAASWLAASAVRAVGWRAALGMTPTTVAFPGLSAPN